MDQLSPTTSAEHLVSESLYPRAFEPMLDGLYNLKKKLAPKNLNSPLCCDLLSVEDVINFIGEQFIAGKTLQKLQPSKDRVCQKVCYSKTIFNRPLINLSSN